MEWANLAIALAALGIGVDGHIRGRLAASRGAHDAAAAHRAALDSAAASKQSAAALERMANQWAESMARAERRDQRQWSSRGRPMGWEQHDVGPFAGPVPSGPSDHVVHWAVSKIQGRRHTLTNLGRATAHDVELTCANAVRFDAPDQPRNMNTSEYVDFLAIGSFQTGTPELTVTWSDTPGGERRSWRRPLP